LENKLPVPHTIGHWPGKNVCCEQKLSSIFYLVKRWGKLFLFEMFIHSFGIDKILFTGKGG
jgi:hypothetical protein